MDRSSKPLRVAIGRGFESARFDMNHVDVDQTDADGRTTCLKTFRSTEDGYV